MNDDFMTYAEFEEFIRKKAHYTCEYTDDKIQIFYDYKNSDNIPKNSNEQIPLREIIFSIGLFKPSAISAPYGFRLTHAKRMKNFSEVEEKALSLSRTPIYLRGKRGG